MELKRKVLKAAFWVSLSSIISRIATILATLILARLLMPLDFGMVAIAALITSAIGLFRELGLSRTLIVQKENLDSVSNTVFYLLIVWNLLLYSVVFLSAPLLAGFFKDAALVPVIRVMTLSLLIAAFGEVPFALWEREMAFKRVATSDVINLVTYSILSVVLAYDGFGYWSIIYGTLIGEGARVLFVWTLTQWRPRFLFTFSLSKEVVRFGGSLTGIGIVNYLIRNIDDTFVGRLLGLVSLGHYNFAYRIANVPATNITNVIGRIMFPAYSQISEHTFDLRNAFNKTFYFTAMATIPLSLMIIVFIPDFFHLFYGNKWDTAILPVQILVVFGLIRSLGSGMGGIFLALKRPEIMLKISSVQLLILTVFLYPVTLYWGVAGVSVLTTICILYSFTHNYIHLKRILGHSLSDILKPITIFSATSIGSLIISAIFISSLFSIESDTFTFFSKILITAIIYTSITIISNANLRQLLRDTFKGMFTPFKTP
ncbi:MAG: lipopolysaccharide biosynthesis protein [Thermodesulfobacteriota bacterium]